MKKFIIASAFILVANVVFAQTYTPQGGCGIQYHHDAAGNRIKRFKTCWSANANLKPIVGGELSNIQEKVTMELFPNPTSNMFSISLNTPLQQAKLELQDIHGKVIQSKILHGDAMQFHIESLAAGTYFVVLSEEKSKLKLIKKVVKE